MRKIIFTVFLMSALLMFSSSAYAAPSGLVANFAENEVDLNWDSEEGYNLGYDVWYSKNGFDWEKLNASTVMGNVYVVGSDKVLPFVNYYFIVSEAGVVVNGNPMDYLEFSTDVAMFFSQKDNVHGNYKKNTNSCAKCHRTHRGNSEALLITTTVNDTCITCHDGTQSKYDVLKGRIQTSSLGDYKDSSSGAFGDLVFFADSASSTLQAGYNDIDKKYTVAGKTASWLELKATPTKEYWIKIYVVPFGETLNKDIHGKDSSGKLWTEVLQVNYREAYFTDSNNLIATGSTVYVEFPILEMDPLAMPMSIHTMGNGVILRDALKDPNNPAFPDGPEWQKPFGCGSCHSVHGQEYNSNDEYYYSLGNNFRMLANKLPATPDFNTRIFGFAETVSGEVYGEKIYYKSGMNDFCMGCHADYTETVNGAVYATMGTNEPHLIDVGLADLKTTLPLQGEFTKAEDYNKNKIMCLTCHSAHGSTTTRTVDNEDLPNFLLRRDESNGVCMACHTEIGS